MTKATITINGRTYDAITGMPVVTSKPQEARPAAAHTAHTPAPAQPRRPVARAFTDVAPTHTAAHTHATAPAQAVHRAPAQKSHTLHRQAVKKPGVALTQTTPPAGHRADHSRSPLITRFGEQKPAHTAAHTKAVQPTETVAPATMHPAVAKALQQQATAEAQKPQLSGKDLKEQLIKERLAEVSERPHEHHKKTGWLGRQPRLVTILSSTLALLILGGYLTYITLPSISLRVAASRAGVNANMPEYKPDGYSLDGPITYSPGEVVISYKSNTNTETGYKLVQKATNWDSQAVLDNYVSKLTDNYLTFQERGVTVYTFGNKAAWVNGGLLYTIDGNAGLSSDQILRVATSL